MRKILSLLVAAFMIFSIFPIKGFAAVVHDEMRAVWISTIYNLDYPSTKNNVTAQKNEFIEKLDALQQMGLNTVIIQVRPKADALYRSDINPWSEVLTGTQGKDPGYDPLEFMIEETHKRGMAIHAWLNPYRVTTSGVDSSVLSSNHPAKLNPSWTFAYNNALYYNPEVEGVKEHIVDTVTEIAENYDVDGIHFDDYFYPSSYPLPSGEDKDGMVANARREAVNDMIKRVGEAIKKVNNRENKAISFGVSPAGIWKNSASDVLGSATNGNQSYYSVYADTRKWVKEEWIDYIVPQIYWETGHSKADYETLVKWWSDQVTGTNVTLYIGQGVYRDVVATQIDTQLTINQKYSQVKGSFFFSLRDLLNNRMSCKDKITNFYETNGGITVPEQGGSNNGDTNPGENDSTEDNVNSGESGSTGGNTNSGNGVTNHVDPSAIGKKGTVTAATLNIREGARVDRPIITKAKQGDKLTIKDILNGWYKVQLTDGTVGWASAEYIRVDSESDSELDSNGGTSGGSSESMTGGVTNPVDSSAVGKTGVVTAATLNIREGARADRTIVKVVTQGTKLIIKDILNGWYKVQLTDGTAGWASAEYIKIEQSSNLEVVPPTAHTFPRTGTVTASSLNVRSGARTDRPVVAKITSGTKVTVLSVLDGWYKIKLTDGTVGWAISSYIK